MDPDGQRPARMPRTAKTTQEPGPAGNSAVAALVEPAPWEGQRVSLNDLADFKRRWGLVSVPGGGWAEGEPCPTLYFSEVVSNGQTTGGAQV